MLTRRFGPRLMPRRRAIWRGMRSARIIHRAMVDALDRLSDRLLAAAAPLRVEVSGTHEPILRLRAAHVLAAGWARVEDLPGGVERDAHDDVALHIVALDGDELVGAIRLVPPVPGRRLPVEEAFGL